MVLLGLVLEGTCSFLLKETFCELIWVYGMLWVSREEGTTSTMSANTGMLVCALWHKGTSGLELRDLHLFCNCLKYLKLRLRFSVTFSMLTASILPQGAGQAGASTPVFFLGDPAFFLGVLLDLSAPHFPHSTWEQDPLRGRRLNTQQYCKMLMLEGSSAKEEKRRSRPGQSMKLKFCTLQLLYLHWVPAKWEVRAAPRDPWTGDNERVLSFGGDLHCHSFLSGGEYVLVFPDHRQMLSCQDKLLAHMRKCL